MVGGGSRKHFTAEHVYLLAVTPAQSRPLSRSLSSFHFLSLSHTHPLSFLGKLSLTASFLTIYLSSIRSFSLSNRIFFLQLLSLSSLYFLSLSHTTILSSVRYFHSLSYRIVFLLLNLFSIRSFSLSTCNRISILSLTSLLA